MRLLPGVDGLTPFMAEEDGKRIFGTAQDCTPILENAHAMQAEGKHSSGDMKLAARLPMVVVETYCNKHGITFADWCADRAHIRRMLNDPDLKGFRIWEGRV